MTRTKLFDCTNAYINFQGTHTHTEITLTLVPQSAQVLFPGNRCRRRRISSGVSFLRRLRELLPRGAAALRGRSMVLYLIEEGSYSYQRMQGYVSVCINIYRLNGMGSGGWVYNNGVLILRVVTLIEVDSERVRRENSSQKPKPQAPSSHEWSEAQWEKWKIRVIFVIISHSVIAKGV